MAGQDLWCGVGVPGGQRRWPPHRFPINPCRPVARLPRREVVTCEQGVCGPISLETPTNKWGSVKGANFWG